MYVQPTNYRAIGVEACFIFSAPDNKNNDSSA